VGPRKDPHLAPDGPDLVKEAAIHPPPLLEKDRPEGLHQYFVEEPGGLGPPLLVVLGQGSQQVLLHLVQGGVHLELALNGHGLPEGTGHLGLHLGELGGVEGRLGDLDLLDVEPGKELLLGGHDSLDLGVGHLQGLDHLVLGEFLGAGLHHADGLAGARHHQVEGAAVHHLQGGVDHVLPVNEADPHGSHRAVEGDGGAVEGRRRPVDGHDVGAVLVVHGEHHGDDLGLQVVPLGEEGS